MAPNPPARPTAAPSPPGVCTPARLCFPFGAVKWDLGAFSHMSCAIKVGLRPWADEGLRGRWAPRGFSLHLPGTSSPNSATAQGHPGKEPSGKSLTAARFSWEWQDGDVVVAAGMQSILSSPCPKGAAPLPGVLSVLSRTVRLCRCWPHSRGRCPARGHGVPAALPCPLGCRGEAEAGGRRGGRC